MSPFPPLLTVPYTLLRNNHHYFSSSKSLEGLKPSAQSIQCRLIINDRLDTALAINETGVHLGQTDMPLSVARSLLPPHMVLGASMNSVQEAEVVIREAIADYIGKAGTWKDDRWPDPGCAVGNEDHISYNRYIL